MDNPTKATLEPLSPEEVKQALSLARSFILRGWCQHRSTDLYWGTCLARALQDAHEYLRPGVSLGPVGDPHLQLTLPLIQDSFVQERITGFDRPSFEPIWRLTIFNDHSLTTKEDVLSLLERVTATLTPTQ